MTEQDKTSSPVVQQPTWDDTVKNLFALPYWIDESRRANIGSGWIGAMGPYFVYLDQYDSVKEWSVTIYNHLASRNMPLTTDETQYWPLEALETFRLWCNQGYRQTQSDPIVREEVIPPPAPPYRPTRVRPDIRSMSTEEINIFRSRLDDIMKIGDPSPDSPWQQWAYIHTNWCLHYQEAFAFWHRAYILYIEELIDHPIPYWDWMAENASVYGSPEAGLPQAYLDETYIHPITGEQRPNPLRYAAAKDGHSKACVEHPEKANIDCQYVQRYPLLTTSDPAHEEERIKWYKMVELFQQQVVDALKFTTFSVPQGVPGYPWANLPAFVPPQPDADYPYREVNFDGLFEQPHDNFHGWIGPDMADNAYTAFDPIFLSYHANIDRMLEVWIRNNPAAQYTTQVIVQPFVGHDARSIDLASPQQWIYTAIGDMAQDSRKIGYDYGPPVAQPFTGRKASLVQGESDPTSTDSIDFTNSAASIHSGPWVVFDGVRCTHDSYYIDVFINKSNVTTADIDPGSPHYVGRFSRIGMGIEDDKDRCIRHGVSRMLDASFQSQQLSLDQTREITLSLLVTHIDSGEVVAKEEYEKLPGFIPSIIWGDPRQPMAPQPACGSCH